MNSKLLRKQENNNMATRNDITGDSIQSKNNSKKLGWNWISNYFYYIGHLSINGNKRHV